MEEMRSLNTPVQRLKVAILPLDLPCSGPVTHSGEILTTGKSHRKEPDRLPRVMKRYSPTGRRNHGRPFKRLLDTWDRNRSISGPTPWKIYDDDYITYFSCKRRRWDIRNTVAANTVSYSLLPLTLATDNAAQNHSFLHNNFLDGNFPGAGIRGHQHRFDCEILHYLMRYYTISPIASHTWFFALHL